MVEKYLIYPLQYFESNPGESGKVIIDSFDAGGKCVVSETWLSLPEKDKINLSPEEIIKLKGYIAKQNLYHSPPELFLEDKNWLKKLPKKPDDLIEQANILLKGLEKLQPKKGKYISLMRHDSYLSSSKNLTEIKKLEYFYEVKDYLVLRALTYCSDKDEFLLLLKSLKESKDIEIVEDVYRRIRKQVTITMKGWKKAQELENKNSNASSKKAFIAMWFHKSMKDLEKSIKTAAKKAGYKAYTIRDIKHSDKIDDKILSEISKSKFVICDITSKAVDKPRASVFFEAGYAKGKGIPVIWTCKESMKEAQSNAFDTRQYKCLFWDKSKMKFFKKELQEHIEKDDKIGKGPL